MRTQAYGGVFPGSPPLDAGKYSKCYGMQLDGYVQVAATAGITSSSAGLDTSSYANRFRYSSPLNSPGLDAVLYAWHTLQDLQHNLALHSFLCVRTLALALYIAHVNFQ